jgi:hypothetical protein
VTITGDRPVRRDAVGEGREEVPADEAAVRRAYREHFGIVLDRLPEPPP